MTLFEYVAAANTLIFSFAVARITAGLPYSIVKGRRYWVHLVFIGGLLFTIAMLFWNFWSHHDDADWTFPRFLLSLAPAIITQFMAATIIPSSSDDVESWEEFYYSIRKRYFSAWIGLGLVLAFNSIVFLDTPLVHPSWGGALTVIAMGAVGLSSSNPRVHARLAVIAIAVGLLSGFLVFAAPGSLAN
jgi:hypothetical protein